MVRLEFSLPKIEGCWNEDEKDGKSLIGQHSSLLSSSRLQYQSNNVNHYFAWFNPMPCPVLRGSLSSKAWAFQSNSGSHPLNSRKGSGEDYRACASQGVRLACG